MTMIDESDFEFIANKYLFSSEKAIKEIGRRMTKDEVNSLFKNTFGALMKGAYALIWQVKIRTACNQQPLKTFFFHFCYIRFIFL